MQRWFVSGVAGLKWMWELHTQRAGGIIGDEMGLGKTIQARPVFLSHEETTSHDGPVRKACMHDKI
jgi:DNA excision repair protein ERCC-6